MGVLLLDISILHNTEMIPTVSGVGQVSFGVTRDQNVEKVEITCILKKGNSDGSRTCHGQTGTPY